MPAQPSRSSSQGYDPLVAKITLHRGKLGAEILAYLGLVGNRGSGACFPRPYKVCWEVLTGRGSEAREPWGRLLEAGPPG